MLIFIFVTSHSIILQWNEMMGLDDVRSIQCHLGLYSLRRRRFFGKGLPIINPRRSSDRLRFITGIPIPVRRACVVNRGPGDPFTKLNMVKFIVAWVRIYIHYKMWDEITYPFPNLKGAAVEVWELMNEFSQTLLDILLLNYVGV